MSDYKELLIRDDTSNSDLERLSLFYILANVSDLHNNIDNIYNFDNKSIKLNCYDKLDLSSSSLVLLTLAFNLYNNCKKVNVLDFSCLDDTNYKIAIDAINIRFNK